MIKVIFADTNKIYSSLCKYITLGHLYPRSLFLHPGHGKIFQIYVSSFVLKELQRIYSRNNNDEILEMGTLTNFLDYTNIYVEQTTPDTTGSLLGYVNDPNDLQILVDALYTDADILLTNNMKDFNCVMIKQKLGLIVTNNLSQEILELQE